MCWTSWSYEAIVSHEDLIEELLGMEIEDEMDKKGKEKLSQQQIQFQQRKNRNVSIRSEQLCEIRIDLLKC